MSKNGKIVLKYSLVTLLVCFVSLIVFLVIMAVGFPKTMGNLMYNMGLKYHALTFYEKNYNRTNNINDLHKIVNLSIKIDNSNKIVSNYETFMNRKEYDNFIKYLNNKNLTDSSIKPVVKSTLINEDDYLKNKYVKALASLNLTKACEFVENNMTDFVNVDVNNLGCYLLSPLIDEKYVTNEVVKGLFDKRINGVKIKNCIVDYFNNLSNKFLEEASYDNVHLIAVFNRINKVYKNILTLNNCGILETSNISDLENVLNRVNEKLVTII